jgi:threonine-phosphate decarboxylase
LSEHLHGGRVFAAALDLGIPWRKIIDFSANINPAGQPPGLKAHLFRTFAETVHYPDVSAGSLVEAISRRTGLSPDRILPGAGSTPHIRMIARILDPRRPVIIGPAFAEYEESLAAAGKSAHWVLAGRARDFLVTPEEAEKAESLKPDLVFVANPANPTGRLLPRETALALLDLSDRTGAWLVVDEAFFEFTSGGFSFLEEASDRPRLLVLRSLTKIFAVPGLRLAYLAGSPESVRPLAAQLEPWPLNCMALEAGLYCLPLLDYLNAAAPAVARLRPALRKILEPFGKVMPSDANFMLMDAGSGAPDVIGRLYRQGILVRDASNFRGLGPGWLRFAVRPKAELKALSRALAPAHA